MATLQGAVDALGRVPGLTLHAVSSVYRTAPWGGVEQDDFLNIVVAGVTELDPLDLLDATQRIELDFDRVREKRWGPRTLDIDLVLVGTRRVSGERLTLPHPRAQERNFVLIPWAEIEPDASLPGWGPIASLASGGDDVHLLPGVEVVLR